MSFAANPGPETVGVPLKLLQNTSGHIVTVEDTTSRFYHGKLEDVDNHMNVMLSNVSVYALVNKKSEKQEKNLDNLYIRANRIRFIIMPPALSKTPLFEIFRCDESTDKDRRYQSKARSLSSRCRSNHGRDSSRDRRGVSRRS